MFRKTWQARSVGTMLFGPRYYLARPTFILLPGSDREASGTLRLAIKRRGSDPLLYVFSDLPDSYDRLLQ